MAGWNVRVTTALEAIQAGIATLTALLTGAEAVDLKVDVAQTDVDAIVDGIAGEAPKTLADIHAVASDLCVHPACTKKITIGASSDLATLIGAALPAGLRRIYLYPEDVAVPVRFAFDGAAADADSPALPTNGMPFDMTAAVAADMRLYAASNVDVTCVAYV